MLRRKSFAGADAPRERHGGASVWAPACVRVWVLWALAHYHHVHQQEPANEPACRPVTSMALQLQQKAALFAAAAAVRLLLFQAFPSLPDRLAGRVELSTPVSSFKRCTLTEKMLYHHHALWGTR